MARYADPTRCPDCAIALPPSPHACPACGLPLTGEPVVRLFATLQSADLLLEQLRASASQPAVPAYAAPPAPPARLSAPSVPRILLSLGVLCLLVAAVTFLAVAWSWLGVGGRTLVLLLLTAATGALGVVLSRRGLRLAAESLTVIGFGLLVLDMVGADNAGWLGSLTAPELVALTGAVVGGLGLVVCLAQREESRPMVAPQVFAALGVWAVPAGLALETDGSAVVLSLAAAGLLALAGAARALTMPLTTILLAVTAAFWWLALVAVGAERALDHATVAELVGQADAWPLVVAVAVLVAAALLVRDRTVVAATVLGAAGILGSLVVLIPASDNEGADFGLVVLTLLLAAVGGTLMVARPWLRAVELPVVVLVLVALSGAAGLVLAALDALVNAGSTPWTRAWTTDAAAVLVNDQRDTPAWMVLPLTAALLLAVVTWRRPASVALTVVREYAAPLGSVLVLAAAVVALLTEQPLALALALGIGAAATTGVWSERRTDIAGAAGLVGVTVVAALAVVVALPSVGLTAVTCALVTAASAGLLLRRRQAGHDSWVRSGAAVVLPAALGGLVWSSAELVSVPEVWRAAPLLLVLGLMAIARPQPELELSAGFVGAMTAAASVAAAVTDQPTALAAYLTLAGGLVTASSLVHDHRRPLAWLGGGLLAAATWVRLWDVGIDVPEAYTLPSAVALLLVGLRHLAIHPGAGTGRALAPGLVLATVPSLLRVLVEDPVSLRAALLGLACLGLVLAGAHLRWQAPLVVGAAVGVVLVLREWGPYAGALPPWVWIAVAGAALLVVGVTWERRLQDLQGSAAYLARLR